ncbi:hypothetical protein [uncultured Acinetobacter sp.]|uniref:hypothetical protein n=1 Tax=uncultured Acinetobacter sp. TaxID=165433 RepID=UPI0026084DE7|nr:hypothetical protein [uncultured Acinetobacter sp.]
MSVQHFTKTVFNQALKHHSDRLIYICTTVALMLTLIIYGSIQGNLKAEYFIYALVVSLVFFIWAAIDHSYRK